MQHQKDQNFIFRVTARICLNTAVMQWAGGQWPTIFLLELIYALLRGAFFGPALRSIFRTNYVSGK